MCCRRSSFHRWYSDDDEGTCTMNMVIRTYSRAAYRLAPPPLLPNTPFTRSSALTFVFVLLAAVIRPPPPTPGRRTGHSSGHVSTTTKARRNGSLSSNHRASQAACIHPAAAMAPHPPLPLRLPSSRRWR